MPTIAIETFIGPSRWQGSPGHDRCDLDLTLRITEAGGHNWDAVKHVLMAAMFPIASEVQAYIRIEGHDVVLSGPVTAVVERARRLYGERRIYTRVMVALTALEGP